MSDLKETLGRLKEGKSALDKAVGNLPADTHKSIERIMEDFDDSFGDCMEYLGRAIRECERLIKEGGNDGNS